MTISFRLCDNFDKERNPYFEILLCSAGHRIICYLTSVVEEQFALKNIRLDVKYCCTYFPRNKVLIFTKTVEK